MSKRLNLLKAVYSYNMDQLRRLPEYDPKFTKTANVVTKLHRRIKKSRLRKQAGEIKQTSLELTNSSVRVGDVARVFRKFGRKIDQLINHDKREQRSRTGRGHRK